MIKWIDLIHEDLIFAHWRPGVIDFIMQLHS